MNLKKFVRSIPDYPKKGILFRDITSLIENTRAFNYALKKMYTISKKINHTKIAGIESRGFIFASAIAARLERGCILLRKPKKLPRERFSVSYQLEYGTDSIEIHKDALTEKDKVLIVDDVLATGGTLCAAIELLAMTKAQCIGSAVVAEIDFLEGRKRVTSRFPDHKLEALFNL